MICPQCNNAFLLPGYALQPIGGFVHPGRCCSGFGGPQKINAQNAEIVFVGKCPLCGHNEELPALVQEILKRNPPPNYSTWEDYWKDINKKIAEDWLEALK